MPDAPGRARARGAIVTLLLIVLAGGCTHTVDRSLVPPSEIATLDDASPFLKAHRSDGGVWVLSDWFADSAGTVIAGTGRLLDYNRVPVDSGRFRIPVDSVVLIETNATKVSGPSVAMAVMTGITAAVALACLTDPKACFGSCPTFYADSGGASRTLQAEGFSASIAPALEATDVDMLLHSRPRGPTMDIRVTNEALETHVIRHADLLAAPRPPGGRVYMETGGGFREAFEPVAPSGCTGIDGDCASAVAAADGIERASRADSSDLGKREVVELEFDAVPDGPLGLVVVSRQTLMTTFLIYQALAYMGSEAGRWLAALETGGPGARKLAGGIGRALGEIEVLARTEGDAWSSVGATGETGPIARDTRVVPLDGVRPEGPAPLRLRLRVTQGLWRIDQVALVRLGEPVIPHRIRPHALTRAGTGEPADVEQLTDDSRTLVTLPGDAYEISYRLPDEPASFELFLESRGYYLEWMRREWLQEENQALATRLLMDPRGALRSLAPAFKEREDRLETLFWSSRYERR